MVNRRNYYRLLQVQPDAPLAVIKNNFRTMMHKLRMHPDLGGDKWTASDLNRAYTTLKDPEQRAQYDKKLLALYGIDHNSRDNDQGLHRSKVFSRNKSSNRRNYCRILQIQHDAAPELINSSYYKLRAAPDTDKNLLQEAFSVLANPHKRKQYDRLLGNIPSNLESAEIRHRSEATNFRRSLAALVPSENTQVIDRRAAEHYGPLSNKAAYEPAINLYCEFCKTPHSRSPIADDYGLCNECDSPLYSSKNELNSSQIRDLSRLNLEDSLSYYEYWPDHSKAAVMTDISPGGLRFTTDHSLNVGQVIKIDGARFKAVGRVSHIQHDNEHLIAGIKFLSIKFQKQRGNFVSDSV